MRRMIMSTVVPGLLTLLVFGSAHAQPYPQPDRVGIYFDTAATTNWRTVQPLYLSTAYLILTNPAGAGMGIEGFECRVVLPANSFHVGVQLPPQSINVATFPDLAVGLATPLPMASAVLLATITFIGTNSSSGNWTLTPITGTGQSIPGAMAYGTGDVAQSYLYAMQPSHVPTAVINPDLSFAVDVQPDASHGAWRLTGPGGYVCEASGDSTFSSLPFGNYTITWAAAGVWAPPAIVTATRAHDQWSGACVFSGAFQERAQVVIAVQPAGLAAPWFLMGPDGFWLQGTGDRTLAGVSPGNYTLIWAPLADWRTPDPSTLPLSAATGQTITFAGQYHTPAAAPGEVAALRLLPARPNPFNPRTSIRFELPHAAAVRLEIFDLAGRRVSTLVEGSLAAGRHDADWDGTDERGTAVAAGVYFARLAYEGGALSERLALVR